MLLNNMVDFHLYIMSRLLHILLLSIDTDRDLGWGGGLCCTWILFGWRVHGHKLDANTYKTKNVKISAILIYCTTYSCCVLYNYTDRKSTKCTKMGGGGVQYL